MHRYPIFQRHHAQIALNFRYIAPMPNTRVSLYFAAEGLRNSLGTPFHPNVRPFG